MDPHKILQAYVGQTQILRVEILTPGLKGCKMVAKKVGVFCNCYSELAFLCSGTVQLEILAKNVS